MHNTICGVVILYYPAEAVNSNIATYAGVLDRLYIVDNTEQDTAFELPQFACETEMLSAGRNIGVAAALNMALQRAADAGYAWLLTMDQDGSFETSQLQKLLHCRLQIPSDNILLLSPMHRQSASRQDPQCLFEETEAVMTSGNLVCVANALRSGGYRTSLFIDEVDHEFCLRGRLNGYKVLTLLSSYLNHHLGTMYIRGGKSIRLYPPERLYYMMRNYLYLRHAYRKSFPGFFRERSRFLVGFFFRHLRFSEHRFSCLRMLAKGWYDYATHRFGRLDG